MGYLIAALVGLGIGPLLFALLHRSEKPQLALDGFVLVAVVGLVALHVLPEAVAVAGPFALVVAAIGLVLPLAAEKVKALSHHASHGVVLAVALLGLLLHASLDGVGLSGSDGLGLAVVLHRIPVGLGVWWLVRPQFGRPWALAVLAALGGATIAGWAAQSAWIEPTGMMGAQLVQALVAGSLLHVLLHQSVGFHNHASEEQGWRVPGAIGAILGGALVGLVPDAHEHAVGERLLEVLVIGAPYALVAIALIVAVARKHAWKAFNIAVPWATAAFIVASMVVHTHAHPSGLDLVWPALFGLVTVVSLANQGPRDFLLKVFPLDVLTAHAHDHGHEHDHGHVRHHAHEGHA